ncbi:MAG: exosortase/archaeosortase family protein [Chitinophagales bacterium]|nr:exosortase/archaeosortase family protein [Chitinophagales bacterium]
MEENTSSKKSLLSDKQTKDFLFFIGKLFFIWLSWKGFIWLIGEESVAISERHVPALSAPWEVLNDWLRATLLHISDGILHLLGYETQMVNEYILRIAGYGGISLGNYCLGFQLMYYFSLLFLVAQIAWSKRIAGVVIGILLIQTLNVFRIIGLILIDVHAHDFMFLSHDYLFNIVVAAALLLFYWWMLREKHKSKISRRDAKPQS